MVLVKSVVEVNFIASLIRDAQKAHGDVISSRALRLTLNKLESRTLSEGLGFLTKTLPRLGKALDQALTETHCLNSVELGFKPQFNSKLPKFLGELFNQVLDKDGAVLRDPCVQSVSSLRLILYSFYKYKLPHTAKQTNEVIESFKKTENDLLVSDIALADLSATVTRITAEQRRNRKDTSIANVVREAKILLSKLFSSFDPTNIVPRHGPGAVSTGEKLWDKYRWTSVSDRIRECYPLDAYFYASLGAFCDNIQSSQSIACGDSSARVVLVPKDSRGPRVISCEPLDNQWIQQGLQKAIYQLVETNELTKFNVSFTNQRPNQIGALLGSESGRYVTLDLKEASDRISLSLVRLLFPEHLLRYFECCRSLATVLPNNEQIHLRKFAPMGSALCFPILALTIWSLLTAVAPDRDTRESILVYGDDVIVPKAYALSAIERLESVGLLVNRDKSCINGLFRESCGCDAYKGKDVTPVRFRTVWSSTPSPESYASWIEYSNQLYDRKCYTAYDLIVGMLRDIYGPIPSEFMIGKSCPSLRESPDTCKSFKTRTNHSLQKREFLVRCLVSRPIHRTIPGWSMLLRYFSEGAKTTERSYDHTEEQLNVPFSVRLYTKRRESMLLRRWR